LTDKFYCFTLKNICKRKISMPEMTRISRLSGGLRWLALVLAAVLPLIVALAVLRAIRDPASLLAQFPGLAADLPVEPWQAGAVAALALLSVLPMVRALAAMAALFARYRAGEVLSPVNADSILTIGRWLVMVALAGVAADRGAAGRDAGAAQDALARIGRKDRNHRAEPEPAEVGQGQGHPLRHPRRHLRRAGLPAG
jgi:hypothetical protein